MRYLLLMLILVISGCGNVELVTNEFTPFEVLSAHNQIRDANGLATFELDDELEKAAQNWAESMASRNKLKHGSVTHSDFSYLGENIAWGQMNTESVMDSWMNSTGHRANILNKDYTHIGVGSARRKNGQLYWCVQFGGK